MRLNNSLIVRCVTVPTPQAHSSLTLTLPPIFTHSHRNIVDVPGAFDYLIACGFRKSIVEFVPYLNFPPAPSAKTLHSLRVGNHVLNHVIVKARAAEEREKRYRESEKEVEAARKAKTMLGFEEDRVSVGGESLKMCTVLTFVLVSLLQRLKREKDERGEFTFAAVR